MTPIKIGHSYYPKSPIQPQQASAKVQAWHPSQSSFAQQLNQTIQESSLKFSHHALTRLAERGIGLTDEQMTKLQDGVDKAKLKGSNESLLLMEGLAFVVSIKNNTVITAIDQHSMNEHIITKIDSAVLL